MELGIYLNAYLNGRCSFTVQSVMLHCVSFTAVGIRSLGLNSINASRSAETLLES